MAKIHCTAEGFQLKSRNLVKNYDIASFIVIFVQILSGLKFSRETLYHLCLLTLLGFSFLGGLLVVLFQKKVFLSLFLNAPKGVWEQLSIGLIYGIACSLIALLIITRSFFKNEYLFFANLIKVADIKLYDIAFFSFCAGVGEEILFRGALQPWLGIWVTAIIFVGLHGYLNPKNWRLSIYGIFMIIVVAGFGYLYERAGLISAIAAHFIIDVILFLFLRFKTPSSPIDPTIVQEKN